VGTIELTTFCEMIQIVDENFKIANIDLLFVSTVVLQRGQLKNKAGLIRCEFLEFLVRVAKFKFLESGMCTNFTESWKMLYNNHIKPNSQNISEWQPFRKRDLWTLDVNDVLQVNLEGLKIVHQHYITPTQKYMSLKDALNLCMKDSGLQLTSKQAKYCVGFCRMTVRAETIDNDAFVKVSFVELLEMIGRIASVKY